MVHPTRVSNCSGGRCFLKQFIYSVLWKKARREKRDLKFKFHFCFIILKESLPERSGSILRLLRVEAVSRKLRDSTATSSEAVAVECTYFRTFRDPFSIFRKILFGSKKKLEHLEIFCRQSLKTKLPATARCSCKLN